MIHYKVVIFVVRQEPSFWCALGAGVRRQEYLYISPTHNLLPHIETDAMSYHKVDTNNNLVHNITNNIDVAYTNVRYLRLCFSVDGDRLFTVRSHALTYIMAYNKTT